MEKKWRVAPVRASERDRLAAEVGCTPVLAALLLNRGIATSTEASRFLEPKLTVLHDPLLLPDMDRAAARVEEAVRRGEPIAVCGDYDVDGLTATALLVQFFRLLGREVSVHIPNRVEDGYGLRAPTVRRLAAEGVRLIVTVDNGSSCAAEVALASELGMDVVVTDHHQVPPCPPAACALVNPWAAGSSYPFPHLSGVGVAFKLAWAVCQKLSKSKKLSPEYRDFLLESLSLTALGTISDVVPLTGENRILARYGLAALSKARRPGLRCLADLALKGAREALRAEHVSFRIAPAINASGRLGNAETALRLLLSASPEESRSLLEVLERENGRRQRIEDEIHRSARARALAEIDIASERAIVLADRAWHPGVIGIVAARLCEEFCRPTILIAIEGDRGRGSGRSIAAVHLCDAIGRCREHIISFGGHARAAGVEVAPDRIEEFRRALTAAIPVAPSEMLPEVEIEAEIGLREIDLRLLRELDRLEPHGFGNRAPLLGIRGASIAGVPRAMGSTGRHLSFYVKDGGTGTQEAPALRAIAFGGAAAAPTLARPGVRVDLAFEPSVNRWGGDEKVELRVREIRESSEGRPAENPLPPSPAERRKMSLRQN